MATFIKIQEKYRSIIGWGGALLSLSAYALNTWQVLSSSSGLYLSLNILACSCLGYYTFYKKAYANTVINSLWLLLSLVGLVRLLIIK